jgi:hypothetical protein
LSTGSVFPSYKQVADFTAVVTLQRFQEHDAYTAWVPRMDHDRSDRKKQRRTGKERRKEIKINK